VCWIKLTTLIFPVHVNPLMSTVAICIQLYSILCLTGRGVIFNFWHPDTLTLSRELNPIWHRMVYSCTHMSTVEVKGLNSLSVSYRARISDDILVFCFNPGRHEVRSSHGTPPGGGEW